MKRKPVYIVFPPWIYSSSRITKRFKDLRLLGVYAPALSSPHSRFRGGKKKNFLSLNPPWIYELYITFCLLVSQQIRVPKVKKNYLIKNSIFISGTKATDVTFSDSGASQDDG